MSQKWLSIIPPFDKKIKFIIIMLLFYSMSPEQMKSVHYISVWVTSQTSGAFKMCLVIHFQSEKNFILGAESNSWVSRHTDLLNIYFFILYFLVLWRWHAVGSSQMAGFSSSSPLGKAVHLLLKAKFSFSFLKQSLKILCVFLSYHCLLLKQHKQDLSPFWGISLSISVAWTAHLLQIVQCIAK